MDRGAGKVRGIRGLRSLGKKIGSVEKIFANENHEPVYVRVRMGFFGLKSVLIPVRFVAIDEERRTLVLK